MGNDTSIDLSGIGKKNNTNDSSTDKSDGIPGLPSYRPAQSLIDVNVQAWTALGVQICIIILNIMMIIVLNTRFLRSIPHVILNNVLVVDLLSGLLPGVTWSVLSSLNNLPWQFLLRIGCDIQGLLNNLLFSVFLLTIFLLTMSQLSHQMFKSQYISRVLLLATWLLSFLFASFPLIIGWGRYDAYDANCWMAWVTGNDVIMSFNIFSIAITLGPAVITTAAAVIVVSCKPRDTNNETSVHTDLLVIAVVQLLIFTGLYATLSILNVYYLDAGYKGVDFKIIIILFFFYYCRGLWNPIVCLCASKEIRSAFVDVILRCRCKGGRSRVVPANGQEGVDTGAPVTVAT